MKKVWFNILFVSFCIFFSCNTYKKTNKSTPAKPDYSSSYYWSALPFRNDSADLVVPNSGLKDMQSTAEADVFYIHPTNNEKGKYLNADLNDIMIRNRADRLACKFQASAFNESCRVYMPRYRDVKVIAYFMPDKKREEIFDIAYGDVKEAFLYYLKHYNKSRPFIIASHSQGADHAIRLCKEFFDKDSVLNTKLIAAYIIGAAIYKNTYTIFKPCSDSLQTNCFVTYNAVRYGGHTFLGRPVNDLVCVNPLTWTTSREYASKCLNKGGLPFGFDRIDKYVADAKISKSGLLWVHKPKRGKKDYFWINKFNYHRLEYNLYYMNIRYNAKQRVDSWLSKNK